MLEYFYPVELRKRFVGREMELKTIKYYINEFKTELPQNIAVWGLRRIGKTMLLKHLIFDLKKKETDVIPIYMDFEKICTTPEKFALNYILTILNWVLDKYNEETYRPEILIERKSAFQKKTFRLLEQFYNEYSRRRPDRETLIKIAFSLPENISLEISKKLVIIIDEFQSILLLKNFRETRNIFSIFRSYIQMQKNILYIFSGSMIHLISGMISESKSPMFLQAKRIPLTPFSKKDSYKLINRLLKEINITNRLKSLIFKLTYGHIFYMESICKRLNIINKLFNREINEREIQTAFLIELISKKGEIYEYLKYIYDISLQKARGLGVLKTILDLLSEKGEITNSEAAEDLNITSQTASDYLRWLEEVDLIIKKENKKYYFNDPLLKLWIAVNRMNIDISENAGYYDIKNLIDELDRKYNILSTEIGKTKEFELYYFVSENMGKSIKGEKIPEFKTIKKNYLTKEGQEIDLIAENHKIWVFEWKWKNKMTGEKEIENLIKKIKADKYIIISKSDFTDRAKEIYKKKKNIILWEYNDIKEYV